jgi:formate hydrogenlyase transcriptional activator
LARGSVLSLDHDLLPLLEAVATGGEESRVKPVSLDKAPVPGPANHSLEEIERGHILRVLDSTGGIIDGPRGAAQVLKLHPSTLRARMKKLRISRPSL